MHKRRDLKDCIMQGEAVIVREFFGKKIGVTFFRQNNFSSKFLFVRQRKFDKKCFPKKSGGWAFLDHCSLSHYWGDE